MGTRKTCQRVCGRLTPIRDNKEDKIMRRHSKKLIEVTKLSIQSQLTIDKNEKVAYLIWMLEAISKNTKYEHDVSEAVNDFYGDNK